MNKSLLLFLILCLSSSVYGVELSLDAKQYLGEDLKPYLEVQFKVPSKSVKFTKNESDLWQAAVKIELSISQQGTEIFNETYPLFSQELKEMNVSFDLINSHKIPVQGGVIKIKIKGTDYITGLSDSKEMELLYKKPYLNSDVVLLENFYILKKVSDRSHGHIFLVPSIQDKIPVFQDTLLLYVETYRKAADYSVMLLNEDKKVTYLQEFSHSENQLQRHLIKLPKLKIGSGKLDLILANEAGEHLKSIPIFLEKPEDKKRFMALNTWEIKHYVLWMNPILSMTEINTLNDLSASSDSLKTKEAFFNFWSNRNPDYPWKEWTYYQLEVSYANKNFSTSQLAGYRTDRGIAFLGYGRPNDIIERHDNPETYPYEIWKYPDDGKMGNATFYFVNYSFTKNNFTLVHSTSLGEIKNPNWRETIDRGNKRKSNNNNIGTGWENEFIRD